jgi:hypothetical protein
MLHMQPSQKVTLKISIQCNPSNSINITIKILNLSWTQPSPLREGLAGTAWEPSKPKLLLAFLTTTPATFSLSLSLSLSSLSISIKDRTMDNVQNCDSYINIPLSQTYR